MTKKKLIDRFFRWTYRSFANALGGKPKTLPDVSALPDRPVLTLPEDYETQADIYSHRYRGAFVINFMLGFIAVLIALVPLTGLLDEHTLHLLALPLTLAEMSCILMIMLIHWYGRDPGTYNASSGLLRRLGLKHINQGWRQRWGRARLAAEQVRFSNLMLGFPGKKLVTNGFIGAAGTRYDDTTQVLEQLIGQCAVAPVSAQYEAQYRRYLVSLLENQRIYHENNAHRYHHIHHRLHRIASRCFYLTLLLCVSHLVLHHPLLSVSTALLPALAATCHGILASGEFTKLSAQSADMSAALAQLEQRLQTPAHASLPTLEPLVRDFYSLVVQDAMDWHLTLRDKDVQAA